MDQDFEEGGFGTFHFNSLNDSQRSSRCKDLTIFISEWNSDPENRAKTHVLF